MLLLLPLMIAITFFAVEGLNNISPNEISKIDIVGRAEKFDARIMRTYELRPIYKVYWVVDRPAIYTAKNDSWSETRMRAVDYIGYYKKFYSYERIGLNLTSRLSQAETIKSGSFNIHNGIVYKWNIDIGDRNFEEFPVCLEYELRKGVCEVVNI